MRKRAFYLGQLVTKQHMVDAFDDVEASTLTLTKDLLFSGVLSGHTVAEAAVPDLTVSVSSGTSFSPDGERIRTAGESIVDCEFDHLEASTAVADPAKSKILSIFILFDTLGSDPQTDANGDTANFLLSESYQFKVVQGAEAVSPTPGAAIAGGVLLAYVTLIFGQTTIVNADIDSDAREDLIVLTGTPFGTSGTGGRYGSYIAALQAIVDRYNDMLDGSGDAVPASSVSYLGSPVWANGSSGIPAGDMESSLDTLVLQLTSTSNGVSGTEHIGGRAITGTAATGIGTGSLYSQLALMRDSTYLEIGAGSNWQDATANPATSVSAMVLGIISTLAAYSSTSLNGARKIGLFSTGNFTAGSIYGGFQQLAATTASNDGALRIGAEAIGGFIGVTVRAQLDELLKLVGGTMTGPLVLGAGSGYTIPFNAAQTYTRAQDLRICNLTQHQTASTDANAVIVSQSDYGTAPCVETTRDQSGDYFWLELDPPDGCTLTSFSVLTKGLGVATTPGDQLATYEIVRWKKQTAEETITSVLADGHTYGGGGNWLTTVVESTQAIAAAPNVIVDRAQYKYALKVVSPWDAGTSSLVRVYDVLLTFTLPELKPA